MNILKKTCTVGLVIAFAGIFSPIGAQSEEIPARGPIPFAAFDKDGNGLISEEEFNTVRGERRSRRAAEGRPLRGAAGAPLFSEFDTNSDGQLTRDELVAGRKARMEKRRGMGIGQGRGMGRGMEMRRGRNMPSFSDIDANGDGRISKEEFAAHRSQRRRQRAQ